MKEKIRMLNDYGVDIVILTPGEINKDIGYDKLYISSNWTDIEVERVIDEKLEFFKNNKWPTLLKNNNQKPKTLCEGCLSYNFRIEYSVTYATYITTEICNMGHFHKAVKEFRQPLLYCKNYKN